MPHIVFPRWARRLLIGLAVAIGIVMVVVALLQVSTIATWTARRLVALVPLRPGYALDVGRVRGDWVSWLEIDDLRLRYQQRELARVSRLRAGYDLRRLRGAQTRLDSIVIEGVRIAARREPTGWDIANALRPSSDTTAAGGRPFAIGRLAVRDLAAVAEIAPDSAFQIRKFSLAGHELVFGEVPVVAIDSVVGEVTPPGPEPRWLALRARGAATPEELRLDPIRIASDRSAIAGTVVLPRRWEEPEQIDRLALRLDAQPLALSDVVGWLPSVRSDGDLRLALRASGEGRRVVGRLTGQLADASLELDGNALLSRDTAIAVQVHGRIRGFDPSQLLAAGPLGSVNGSIDADVHGPSWRRVNGRVDVAVNHSRIGQTALERIMLGATFADGRAELAARGRVGRGTIRANGTARPFDSVPSYRLAGEARNLPGGDSLVHWLAGPQENPELAVQFDVEGDGTNLDAARLVGRAEAIATRKHGAPIQLAHLPFTFANRALELQPELFVAGGRITALATVRLGDTLSYELRRGNIHQVDLGRLAGDTIVAPFTGTFTASGRGVTPAEAVARARFEASELRYGARRIEGLEVVGRLDRGNARVTVDGAVQGGRVSLDVAAKPFDSTRTFLVHRAALDRVDVGALFDLAEYRGPVTLQLSGRGRLAGTRRTFAGRVHVDSSRLGRIQVYAGAVSATVHDDVVAYDGSLQTNGGAIVVAGNATLGAEPAFNITNGRFDSLDLATLLGQPKLASRLNGQLTGAIAGRGVDSTRGDVALELGTSKLGATAIQSGRLTVALDRGAIRGNLHVASSDGQFDAEAALRALFDSAGLASIDGSVTANGAFRDIQLDTLLIALRPSRGEIDVDTMIVRSNALTLDGGGRLALQPSAGSDTLRIVGFGRDLAPLAALAGIDTMSVGAAHLSATIAGPAQQWHVSGAIGAEQLAYTGNHIGRIAMRASATIDTSGVRGMAGDLQLENAALGGVAINALSAVGRYDSLVTLQGTATLRDSINIITALHGEVTGDTLRATLDRLDLKAGASPWALTHPVDLVLRPRIEVNDFVLQSGDRSIRVDGTLDRTGSSDLALQANGIDLDALRSLGVSPIPGRLDGSLRLRGPAKTPVLDGKFDLAVRRGAQEVGRLGAQLAWTNSGLRVEAVAAPTQGGRLTASGTLPWRLTLGASDTTRPDTASADTAAVTPTLARATNDTIGFIVRSDSFDLAFFDPLLPPKNAKNLRGLLAVDTRVTGTIDEPQVNGRVRLAGLGIDLPPLGLAYQAGELDGELTGTELRLNRLHVLSDSKQELTAQGTVNFRPLTNPSFDISAALNDFRIANSTALRSLVSGRVQLQGTVDTPTVTGKVRLGRTEVMQGAEGNAVAVRKVELTEADIRELVQHFGPGVLPRLSERGALLDRFKLDVDVQLPGNVWFRRRTSPSVDIELTGQVKIVQAPGGDMEFFGRVEPTPNRGFLDVYGREFRLSGGEIQLDGPIDSMTLDVTAQYQVPAPSGPDEGIVIDVAAQGRIDSLSLTFTSEPSLDQDDILSYIVTGRPASENPFGSQEGQTAGEAGAALAVGGLSERLAGVAGRSLGLDVFQIKPDGVRGLTLTAGRYVAPKVFLSIQQPIQLSTTAQQTPGFNLGPGFEVEYTARRWLRANVRGGSLPARFFLRGRYAY